MSYISKIILVLLLSTVAESSSMVDILDPTVLESLDKPGFYSLATVLGEDSAEQKFLEVNQGNPQLKNLKIFRLSEFNRLGGNYQIIKDTISNDVLEIIKLSGEKMAYSSEQAEVLFRGGNGARHFDYNWFKSQEAAFPLIAVINRIDKKDFYPNTCGELRFIYRLTYYKNDLGDSRSTLPLFLNVVYDYKKNGTESCVEVAKLWAKQPNIHSLISNPLNKKNLVLKQIELNMQVVRYPSGQKTDFGGQAIYLFRIFQFVQGRLTSIPLENTPDVATITNSPELKSDLVSQITNAENLKKIDEGTFILKNTNGKMLATKALSFSTNGRSRLANKPYSAIFNKNLIPIRDIPYNNLKFIKSPSGLMERLNNNSCVGCHQTSGTAGFHMLGYAGKFNSNFNKVILPFSPHYSAEQKRREHYTDEVAKGNSPTAFRPPSFYPRADWAKNTDVLQFENAKPRDLCVQGSSHFGASFSCAKGSICKNTVINKDLDLEIGECVRTPNVIAGHVCREGVVTNSEFNMDFGDFYNLKSGKDSININKIFKDTSRGCGNPNGGVPLGRISIACDSNTPAGRLEFVDRIGKEPLPEEICAMRGGPQFDECAKSKNPPDCLAKAKIARGLLDTCSPNNFCREDYICQELPVAVANLYQGKEKELVQERIKKLAQNEIGFCVPNYFIFNMRTDGHIIP